MLLGTVLPAQAATPPVQAAAPIAQVVTSPAVQQIPGPATSVQVGTVGAVSATAVAGRLVTMASKAVTLTTKAIPYQYGGGHGAVPAPLGTSVDCSGFIRSMYYDSFRADIGNGSGDSIVRLSGKFTKTSRPVVGDVALFGNGGQAPAYHAGIYIGNGPGGTPAVVAAPQTGSNITIQEWGTRYWSGDLMGYWHYNGATAADSSKSSITVKAATKVATKARGNIDKVSSADGRIKIVGWAYDPAKSRSANAFTVLVDGRAVYRGTAKKTRSDIARNLGIGAAHGINITVKAKPGTHKVSLVSKAAKGSKTRSATVDTASVLVTVKAKGAASVTGATGNIRVSGWTFDPQTTRSPNKVVVTVDGRTTAIIVARKVRTDVARIYGITSKHGFGRVITLPHGRHVVTVTAVGNKATTTSTVLFHQKVTVALKKK